jgi:hypothetical protein
MARGGKGVGIVIGSVRICFSAAIEIVTACVDLRLPTAGVRSSLGIAKCVSA